MNAEYATLADVDNFGGDNMLCGRILFDLSDPDACCELWLHNGIFDVMVLDYSRKSKRWVWIDHVCGHHVIEKLNEWLKSPKYFEICYAPGGENETNLLFWTRTIVDLAMSRPARGSLFDI